MNHPIPPMVYVYAAVFIAVVVFMFIAVSLIKRLDRSCNTIEFHLRMFMDEALREPSTQLLDRARELYRTRSHEFSPQQEATWRDVCYFVERALYHKIGK